MEPDQSLGDSAGLTPRGEIGARKDQNRVNGKEARLSPRAKLVLGTLTALVAIVWLVWVVHYETLGKYLQKTDDAYVQADMVVASPKVSGYVDKVFVVDNQDVKANDPLVAIDPRDYKAQVAQYQAQIDVANANADDARAGTREQEAAIDQAQAQLGSVESDSRHDAGEVERYLPLAASGAETREKLASLQDQAARSAASVVGQKAALEQAKRRIGALEAQLRQAQAQGETATAQLAAASVNLQSTVVRSSINGRVGDKSVQVGQYVQAGTRMMSIVPVDKPYVIANFKETQVGRMRSGQPATIRVDALPGRRLKARVDSISPGTGSQFSLLPPQNATGNFTKIVQRVPVRLALNLDPADRSALKTLVPGLSVTAEVDTRAEAEPRHTAIPGAGAAHEQLTR